MFGNLYPLTGDNWSKCFILCDTDVCLLEINNAELLKILDKQNENYNYKQLLNFLSYAIEGFDKVSRVKRDRIAKAFKEKAYPAGYYFVKEGEVQNVAYLILEGECLQVA